MKNSFLNVENIFVTKGNTNILSDITFSMNAGEIISILGPSGSGKTTLINTLMGFNKIESGKIECNGNLIANSKLNKSVESREFSAVFQSLNLFPHLSVRENILYGISSRSKMIREKRLEELAAVVNLSDKLNRDVTTLSGGEKQRVAIARALAPKPHILFLDEPFSSLDKNLQTDVRRFIKNTLKQSGVAAFLVTHDKEDASYFSDRVMVINNGKVVQFDTAENIYNNPANDFVASFFGLNLKLQKKDGQNYYPCLSKITISSTRKPSSKEIVGKGVVVDSYFNLGSHFSTIELENNSKIVIKTKPVYDLGQLVNLHISL